MHDLLNLMKWAKIYSMYLHVKSSFIKWGACCRDYIFGCAEHKVYDSMKEEMIVDIVQDHDKVKYIRSRAPALVYQVVHVSVPPPPPLAPGFMKHAIH